MLKKFAIVAGILFFAITLGFTATPHTASASGGGGGGTKVDTIKVSKAEYAPNQTLLVKASSSNPTATLSVYTITGQYVHDVQNGGGSRYGGTVIFFLTDPGHIVIRSSAGGSITVATTPYQP